MFNLDLIVVYTRAMFPVSGLALFAPSKIIPIHSYRALLSISMPDFPFQTECPTKDACLVGEACSSGTLGYVCGE